MAAPSYSTDLTLLNNAESGTWVELAAPLNGGGAPTINDTDYYIQGGGCVSQALSTKSGLIFSMAYDNGSPFTLSAGHCVFVWQVLLAGNAMDTFANGGLRIYIGQNTTNLNGFASGGNDFGRNPYGGWQNIAIDPTYTPVDYTIGTPNTTYQVVASVLNTLSVISKGNVHGVDAIYYGRGIMYNVLGDTTTPANFTGMSSQNDSQSNRWGLVQREGTGFLYKGLLRIGTGTTSTGACYFRDANRNVTIDNTPRTYSGFNRIEIVNTGTTVIWDAINFTALNASQLSKGQLEVVDNASVTMTSCVFTDMSTFIYKSNSTLDSCIYRRCSTVTQSGATFDSCLFVGNTQTPALLANNPSVITNCEFIKGSGHAIEITQTGTYTFVGNTFSGGFSGATGTNSTPNSGSVDAMIYNNSGGAVTLNISGGDTPSIRNGAGATTTVNNTVNVTITGLKDLTEVRVYATGTNNELAGVEDATAGSPDNRTFTFGLDASTTVDIAIVNKRYDTIPPRINGYVIPASNTSFGVVQLLDPNYNGTGT